ncbi:MAG: M14 family zinc carboxypeptidase [Candidatus Bathyarchaeota archaeon]|nr:M14 family zinc carboxypeptidase [Candidatus Bathyarchaeota archaeon]
MVAIDYGKYPSSELEGYMKKIHEEYHGFTELYSIDQTLQNRDLWTMEITNKKTGPVEIGGVERKYTRRNPPPGKWLEYEINKSMMFALRHAALLPLIMVIDSRVTKVADEVYKVSARVENTSFMPTNVTKMAVQIKAV